ncbi:penicillin-binding transpeptidase domain-containing protein [Corynebacterium terpenotabidum]|uniref:Penicillin-binding protein n=1 Tax=Corynebacterium terpenotabidum Y-11 TaxID=1200352 RepID=S4XD05_9CORY|nr:penicillin-binding transpeptidase domain-containing protein [Corynebacterium terpenotabidum]AGP31007.1 penicillin-binding protein [Corynebacterium terpenotabidum Y-11]
MRPTRSHLRRILAAVSAVSLVSAAACTPRPDVADDVVKDFLGDLEDRDIDGASGGTDAVDVAAEQIDATWTGLQADGLDATLNDVKTNGDVSTAMYTLDWDLPGDRNFTYDATLTATKSGSDWTVRWSPTVMHPDLGNGQHLELRKVAAQTADVVGSDGAVLLTPGIQWRINVDTDKVTDLSGTMRKIAAALESAHSRDDSVPTIDVATATSEAQDAGGTYSVAVLSDLVGSQVSDILGDVDGVSFNDEPTMVRPDPGFAPDILSRISGLVGDDLEGTDGWEIVKATSGGASVGSVDSVAATPAPAVEVSLSKEVQTAAQLAVDTRDDAQAMMVVLRPSTGEILAVAQTPKADEEGDLALTGQYPPGSTFKMITAAAGVGEQDLTAASMVGCPSTINLGGRTVTNYNGFSLGTTTLRNAFAQSCNTTFAEISTNLPEGKLKDVAADFGLGRDYDIPGLDTITGSVPTGEVMLDLTESGYGQGLDLASPFGMALVAATVANGRTPVPTLVETGTGGTKDADGEAATEGDPIDQHVLDNLREMMRAVVTSGSGSAISGAGEVYAKTGEAEYNGGSHAWFAGYRGDLAFATLIVGGGGSEHAVAVTSQFFTELDNAGGE